jgi:hypothetical protein
MVLATTILWAERRSFAREQTRGANVIESMARPTEKKSGAIAEEDWEQKA